MMLQNLFFQEVSQPTVLIFPDISGSIMSLILDYIYTGHVHLNTEILPEFVSTAEELKIQLDLCYLNKFLKNNYDDKISTNNCTTNCQKIEDKLSPKIENCLYTADNVAQIKTDKTNAECGTNLTRNGDDQKKNLKRIPNLMPISAFRSRRGLYNHVTPSPWCPRVAPLISDPRNDCITYFSNSVRNFSPF